MSFSNLATLSGLAFTTSHSSFGDIFLQRDAADTLAQRRTTNAQAFRIYNTYTDASNFCRLSIISSNSADATSGVLAMEIAGTGTTTGLRVQGKYNVSGTGQIHLDNSGNISFGQYLVRTAWTISSSGHFIAGTDNTYDIGASGATRPRSLFLGTSLTVGTSITATGSGGMALGTGASLGAAWLKIGASLTGVANINLPATGVAPTSPVNGDIWFDGTNIKIQIGGATKTFTVT
jgi:hypothetical protein